MKRTRAAFLTAVASVFNVGAMALFGLVYTQQVLEVYGSSVNGLVSTLVQFVTLFTVLEGGFTTAATVALYKPVARGDLEKVSDIVYTASRVFQALGACIALLSFALGIVYVQFIDSPLTDAQTVSLLAVTVLTTAISIANQSKYSVIFGGFNRQFAQYLIATVSKTITWIAAMVLILERQSIVLVFAAYSTNVVLNALLYWLWRRTRLREVSRRGAFDVKLIAGTRDVFLQRIANAVFTSTDMVLISAGISLAQASVYYVYNQIFTVVSNALSAIASAPQSSLGHLWSEGDERHFSERLEQYQLATVAVASIVLSITGMSLLSFISVYTRNVGDADYIVPSVAFLLYTQHFLTACNKPYGTSLNITGNFRAQNKQCVVAAIANIAISLAAIPYFGVKGVIGGSIVGVAIIFAGSYIRCREYGLLRRPARMLVACAINYIAGLALIYVAIFVVPIRCDSYLLWALVTLCYVGVATVVVGAINTVISQDAMKYAFRLLLHRGR